MLVRLNVEAEPPRQTETGAGVGRIRARGDTEAPNIRKWPDSPPQPDWLHVRSGREQTWNNLVGVSDPVS